MRFFLLIYIFFGLLTKAMPQEYASLQFSSITSNENLPSDECNVVFQDSDDFLWFGTNEGLYRYDGYEVRDFDDLVNFSSKNLKFNDAVEDSAGKIWFATSNGVIVYDKKAGATKLIEPSKLTEAKSISDQITKIVFDKKERMWFGSDTGLFLYDIHSNCSIYYPTVGNANVVSNIRDILVTRDGTIWMATWGSGLVKFNEQDSSFSRFMLFDYSSKTNDKHNVLNSLHASSDNILWVGSWGHGLYAVDISAPDQPRIVQWWERKDNTANTILGNIIFDMVTDNYGNLWIGCPYGLSIIQSPLSENFLIHNYVYNKNGPSLTNNVIRSLLQDRTGVIWLGTTGGGVNKTNIHKRKFSPYAITEVDAQKKSQTVNSFSTDRQNRLLIGVKSLAFGVYDIDKELFIHYSDIPEYAVLKKLPINTVKNFTWDKDSSLWMGTRYIGLVKFDLKTGKWIRLFNKKGARRMNAKEIFSVKKDFDNNLWAVTDKGLFKVVANESRGFDDYTVEYYSPVIESSGALDDEVISDITFDRQGRLYVSTFEGSLVRSAVPVSDRKGPMGFTHLVRHDERPLVSINCLFWDSKDQLWVGSLGKGLKKWNENTGRYDCPLFADEMDDRVIYAITEDHYGNLWATSNQGLLHLKSDEEGYSVATYTSGNGLQGNVFIKGAMMRDKNGHIYVGGHNGFNCIDPVPIEEDVIIPKVAFTSLKTGKETVNPQSFNERNPFTIRHDDNLFSISFASLDMRAPGETRYAYKLEGLEDDWQMVSANSRTATYVNLKPGHYTFKVIGTNVIGQWNSEIAVLPIVVKTAPYFTWWAYTLYAIAIIGVILLIFLMYRNQMKARQELKIEHVERTKSEKLSQFKLQFFTNLSHELLTPLSILLILSEKWSRYGMPEDEKFPKMFERNVDKLHHQIKQMLQFRKAESGNLKLELNKYDLDQIIKESYENYLIISEEKKISFELLTSGIGEGFVDREKLDICLNNLLSNAFKYTKKEGTIRLEVGTNKGWITIKVKDSGRGIPKEQLKNIFNRFYRTSYTCDIADGIGIGLALTKNMVNFQGGSIKVESEPGKGSTFTLQLPISLSYHKHHTFSQIDPIITDEDVCLQGTRKSSHIEDRLEASPGQQKTILIVEDNEDFLTLVTLHLEKYYHVISAMSGKVAFDLANSNEVDLIVSDLMIPGMDGYQLCKAIKNDVNTSHIPFIIVTANANDDGRMIGYEVGVDSYLTKPVNLQVLISRIASLLKKRNEIHAEFNMGAFLEPKKIVTTSIDENILSKAKAVVEDYMSDPELTVKVLCDELAMSNSMLYRKIKGILNLTPNEFIRNIRLRKAAQLLEDKSIQISEVAYRTGFSDLSYFGVCFKKQYGVTPSVFQKEKEEKKAEILD